MKDYRVFKDCRFKDLPVIEQLGEVLGALAIFTLPFLLILVSEAFKT
jgi:hypothetical protein